MFIKEPSLQLPSPRLKIRPRNSVIEATALSQGLHPIIARILASRPLPDDDLPLQVLENKLVSLSSPWALKDIDKAATRVATAIINQECIGIETDHDCDGQTSHAVLFHNLIHRFGHPATKLRSYIGHRLSEGYGLSLGVAQRILNDEPRPTLIITADNGSSDEARIRLLQEAGIDVIVTDHHELPQEGPPISSYACLNPSRVDCSYADPFIAGCMVAWLLMAAVRQKLIACHFLPTDTPSLSDSLDFVAVGTVADCVSMGRSYNNRAVVAAGLKLIQKRERPCWQALEFISAGISSEDLGFRIGPLLNSDGRLDTAFGSVSFLLAPTLAEAKEWVHHLQKHNSERKRIQQDIVQKGLQIALSQTALNQRALSIYLADGHVGVHGIAASRIKDAFGRPTAFLAPKAGLGDLISGSVRGIDGFHVREALQAMADQYPKLFIAFGGHKGAGGFTIKAEDIACFQQAFDKAALLQLPENIQLGPILWTDGELEAEFFDEDLLKYMDKLEPFGREFEMPVFEVQACIQEIRPIGDGRHARLKCRVHGRLVTAVWFSMRNNDSCPMPVSAQDLVKMAFVPKRNNMNHSLELQILHMKLIPAI